MFMWFLLFTNRSILLFINIIITIQFENVPFFHDEQQGQTFAHLGCTHSPQVFLPLSLHFTHSILYFYNLTPNYPHSYAQMSKPSQSTTLHHISHTTLWRLYKSLLRFLSFDGTPHIHLTVICSVLYRLYRFSAFFAHVLFSISQHNLDTSSGNLGPLIR